jgi:hypothetical protein
LTCVFWAEGGKSFLKNIFGERRWNRQELCLVRGSVIRERFYFMAREAHLEAAKHHLDAASKHLAAVEKYNEGDLRGAEKHSEEAWVTSQFADGKSVEAHRQATMAVKMKLV